MKNTSFAFLFSIFATIYQLQNAVSGQSVADYGHCIWYGVGVKNPDKVNSTIEIGDDNLNAAYNGDGVPTNSTYIKEGLKQYCPTMYDEIIEYYGGMVTCCDEEMVSIMVSQIGQIDTFLGRCPACVQNMQANFCYMTCHPRQSSFLVATEYYEESVYSIDYYINPTFVNGTFDSCDGVYYPELNTEAIFLFCGGYGTECTPTRLFDFLGDNDFAPFLIDYQYIEGTTNATDVNGDLLIITSMNVPVVPCYTNDTNLACACADCIEKCPPPPEPEEEKEPLMVGEMRLNSFILVMLWLVFIVVVVIYFMYFRDPDKTEKIRKISFNQKNSARLEEFLIENFTKMETKIAQRPFWSILGALICITILSLGNMMLEMTADPVELWSSPDSRTRKEKDYYDENFGPFYRTTQIIAATKGLDYFVAEVAPGRDDELMNRTWGPVLDPEFMMVTLKLQNDVLALVATYEGRNVTINDVCIKPLSPSNDECLLQTAFNYWQNNVTRLTDHMRDGSTEYLTWFHKCTRNPTYSTAEETCLGTYGGPVLPYVALGGFLDEGETLADDPDYDISTALVMTFLLENYVDKDDTEPARAWEKEFLDYMEDYSHPLVDFAYYSERSVEDELIEEGKSDVSTIVISYLIMFAYVTIALGSTSINRNYFITSKMCLGLGGVIIVLLSVMASMGFYGYVGVKSTIFVVEVVPFLVLAIGVDNIFIMVQNLQRTKRLPDETIEEHVGRAVGQVLPSILITTFSEALCFFLGALSRMPAVHSFALCAGMALFINFVLQLTFFVALLTLDAKREEANRYDVLCCIKKSKKSDLTKNDAVCYKLFRDGYGPFLTHRVTQMVVLIVFVGGFLISCSFIPRLPVGLEQDTAFSSDSYLIKYFDFLGKYLSVGAPIYFVVKEGFDYTKVGEQNLFCSTYGCQDDSILTQIIMASYAPDVSYIATGPSSWLESYFSWISDTGDLAVFLPDPETACCRLDEYGSFINSSESIDENAVKTCLTEREDQFYEKPYDDRPLSWLFMEYLPAFLIDNPHGSRCPEAGHPAYGDAVNIMGQERTNHSAVGANYYMAYHTILRTSADFTNALDMAYQLTDELTDYLRVYSNSSVEIFPYSIFYVYYEQYLTMWKSTAFILGVSLAGVIIVMLCLTAFDVLTTLINTIVITMILCDLMACMYGWNIDLNAVSLVNLVMTIGISVEFSSHFTHAFNQIPTGTRRERTIKTLATTGTSILSGITFTKFAGIIVLAFANSEIFKVYYFRMFLLMVLLGVSHGLIFLPVLTSLIGHPANPYLSTSNDVEILDSKEPYEEKQEKKMTNGVANASYHSD